jgi:hypothetical protein
VDPLTIEVNPLTVEPIAAHGPVAIGTSVGVVDELEELPQAASAQINVAAAIAPASRIAPGATPR